jgi:hypothetical protein
VIRSVSSAALDAGWTLDATYELGRSIRFCTRRRSSRGNVCGSITRWLAMEDEPQSAQELHGHSGMTAGAFYTIALSSTAASVSSSAWMRTMDPPMALDSVDPSTTDAESRTVAVAVE